MHVKRKHYITHTRLHSNTQAQLMEIVSMTLSQLGGCLLAFLERYKVTTAQRLRQGLLSELDLGLGHLDDLGRCVAVSTDW